MDKVSAQRLVSDTFKAAFDKRRFRDFVNELCNGFNEDKAQSMQVPDAFVPHVRSCQRLGTFVSSEGELADVLVVHLTESYKLDRSRTALRDFVAHKLKRDNSYKEAGLVAFVAPDSQSWRFSFVRMEYETKRDERTGKIKPETRLTPARRYSYLVGSDEECHTAQVRFLPLLQNTTEHPALSRIEDAFSVESVTGEFFREYSRLFETTRNSLDAIVKGNKALREEFNAKSLETVDFAKKLLGQIVFLYFVQKKGWLGVARGGKWGDGPRNFLRTLANNALREQTSLFNEVLEPLFYDTLASDRGHDAWCKRFQCRIPFLNGGLFEPLAGYDWERTAIGLPNAIFTNQTRTDEGDVGNGIFDVFDRYNFTVNEADPLEKEVAIDPEMLGKVFENLIEDNRRKGLGAYYTPREIVHYMCQESLISYLDTAVNPTARLIERDEIEALIREGEQAAHYELARKDGSVSYVRRLPKAVESNARALDDALQAITVCDPAIGSGAFPVGMMAEIVRARVALTPYFDNVTERTPYHFKRHAIHSSLYGSDIDAGAVEIAKLRLWLSLIVDELDVQEIKPLPNLDYKVVVGNALTSVQQTLFNKEQFDQLETLKEKYFNESRRSQKAKFKSQIDQIIREVIDGRKVFDFEIHFSEVFHSNGGFDVVIANPPYIKEYTERSAFDGLRESPYYQGKMDLWYLFACKSLDLLKANAGLLCFIATNNWVTNSGATILRDKVAAEATILKLLDFGDFKIFETAAIQTMVLLCVRSSQPRKYRFDLRRITKAGATLEDVVDLLKKGDNPKVSYLSPEFDRAALKNKTFTFSDDSTEQVLSKMVSKRNFALIGSQEVAQGIVAPQDSVNRKTRSALRGNCKVGDGIFVLSQSEKNALKLLPEELELVKPYYTSDELFRYFGSRKHAHWIIYTDSTFSNPRAIKPYPNIKRHLDRFRSVITSSNHPYGLHRSRDERFFRGEKLISIRKCAVPAFTYTDFDCYVSQTFNVIRSGRVNMKYLCGLLNSRLVAFWLKRRGKMQGHQFQIDKEPLLEIPLALGSGEQQALIADYVQRILETKLRNSDADVSALERKIDMAVYAVYGLDADEISLVEADTQALFDDAS